MKKLLRLFIMLRLNHDEEYYREEATRVGLSYIAMTTEEMCLWKSSIKAIEADSMIAAAFHQKRLDISKTLSNFNATQSAVNTPNNALSRVV